MEGCGVCWGWNKDAQGWGSQSVQQKNQGRRAGLTPRVRKKEWDGGRKREPAG